MIQLDSDLDGLGDACDLCEMVPSPINTDGDRDGCGDPCDPPALLAPILRGPRTGKLGGSSLTYEVTFWNTSPWTVTAEYTIKLKDPTGYTIALPDPNNPAPISIDLAANGVFRPLPITVSLPPSGPRGIWKVIAELTYTGEVKPACGLAGARRRTRAVKVK